MRLEPNYCIIVDDDNRSGKRLLELIGLVKPYWKIRYFQHVHDAIKEVIENKPDLVFLDIEMPLINGFDFLDETRKHSDDYCVVFVTGFEHYAIKAIRARAFDYLLKPVDLEELKKVLGRVSNYSMASDLLGIKQQIGSLISPGEIKVLELLKNGLSVKQISSKLAISELTVATHKKSIYKKLKVRSQSELIVKLQTKG